MFEVGIYSENERPIQDTPDIYLCEQTLIYKKR